MLIHGVACTAELNWREVFAPQILAWHHDHHLCRINAGIKVNPDAWK